MMLISTTISKMIARKLSVNCNFKTFQSKFSKVQKLYFVYDLPIHFENKAAIFDLIY